MAYTITLTSGVKTIESDTLQMILVLNVNLTGSNQSYTFAEKNIRVDDWGVADFSYDFEDALLLPGTLSPRLSDSDGYLDGLLFGITSEALALDKKGELTIKLNGNDDYVGYIQEDSIESDNTLISFTCDPKMSLLNKAQLFDKEGNGLNPLGLSLYSVLPFTDFLEAAYQLVNPAIIYGVNLEVSHDWQFSGVRTSPLDAHLLGDITLEEIKVFGQHFFAVPQEGVTTVGDFLKKLALDFCAFTGMVHYGKAFFKKLFYYDASNLQTLEKVYQYKKRYRHELIDYVYAKIDIPNLLTDDYEQGDPGEYLENAKIERNLFTGFHVTGSPPQTNKITQVSASVSRGGSDDGTYEIYAVSDSTVDSGADLDNYELMAKFWYNKRNAIVNSRTDYLLVKGIEYDVIKNFTYSGKKYQPISMKKHYSQYKTEFDALYLGEV